MEQRTTQIDKILVVFDFDHTVINCNSDQVYWQLIKDQDQIDNIQKTQFPQLANSWTNYMNALYQYMYNVENTKIDQIKNIMQSNEVQLTEGMRELIQYLKQNNNIYDTIVVSDSNTYFIDWILQKENLENNFLQIFSNHASEENGLLKVQHHHKHNCPECPPNICKKQVLSDFIKQRKQINYTNILYVGDGGNDYCPLDVLPEQGVVYARKGFSLQKKLNQKQKQISCTEFIWNNGNEILTHIQEKQQQQ